MQKFNQFMVGSILKVSKGTDGKAAAITFKLDQETADKIIADIEAAQKEDTTKLSPIVLTWFDRSVKSDTYKFKKVRR